MYVIRDPGGPDRADGRGLPARHLAANAALACQALRVIGRPIAPAIGSRGFSADQLETD